MFAACSSNAPQPVPETAPPTSESSGPVDLELGETANLVLGANGPRDIDVTVMDITVADECRYGFDDYGGDPNWAGQDDGYYIEVTGTIDSRESPDNFTISSWMATDADRNIIEVAPAFGCKKNPAAGMQTFGHLVLPGTKAKASEEYWVDTLPARWYLNQPYEDHAFSWPVPEGPEQGEGTPSTTAAPAAAVSTAQAPKDCLVGSYGQPQFQGTQCLDKQIASCAPANGSYEFGTTFFTDGTSGWTQVCGDQMVAEYVPTTQSTQPTYSAPAVAPTKAPEVEAEKEAGHLWWADCMAANTADFCRANDPWQ